MASLAIGSLTALRVGPASQEDAELIRAMNRLRAAYVALAPEIEPYLTASTHDDRAGLMATYTLGNRRPLVAHIVGSPAFFLIVINTMVAATLGALVAAWAGCSTAVVVSCAAAAALVWLVAQAEVTRRLFAPQMRDVRFPTGD